MELKTKIYLIALILSYVLGVAVATVALKEIPYFTTLAYAFLVAANILVSVPMIKRRLLKVVVWFVLVAIWLALWAYAIVNKLP
jgi:hypothetical protein